MSAMTMDIEQVAAASEPAATAARVSVEVPQATSGVRMRSASSAATCGVGVVSLSLTGAAPS